jgi:hypothetical protein
MARWRTRALCEAPRLHADVAGLPRCVGREHLRHVGLGFDRITVSDIEVRILLVNIWYNVE